MKPPEPRGPVSAAVREGLTSASGDEFLRVELPDDLSHILRDDDLQARAVDALRAELPLLRGCSRPRVEPRGRGGTTQARAALRGAVAHGHRCRGRRLPCDRRRHRTPDRAQCSPTCPGPNWRASSTAMPRGSRCSTSWPSAASTTSRSRIRTPSSWVASVGRRRLPSRSCSTTSSARAAPSAFTATCTPSPSRPPGSTGVRRLHRAGAREHPRGQQPDVPGGLNHRLRGAALGHLCAFESTSSVPCRRIAAGIERVGLPEATAAYFHEHVEADAAHEQIVLRDICGNFVESEPDPTRRGAFRCRRVPVPRRPGCPGPPGLVVPSTRRGAGVMTECLLPVRRAGEHQAVRRRAAAGPARRRGGRRRRP